MAKRNYNHPINHIGLSVPDVEAATKWYTEILGFTKICPIGIEDHDINPRTPAFRLLPSGLQKLKIAFLSSSNGVGLELFEFIDPKIEPGRESSFETGRDLRRGGLFHFAVTAPDVEEMCKKAIENGAKPVGEKVHNYGEDFAYIQDPWGNAIEILSCSYEQVFCNRS